MDIQSIIFLAFVCASGAISPGPSLAVVIKNTLEGGRTLGILTGVGHGLGLTIYAFLAVVGLSSILIGNQNLFVFIQVLGAFWLIYIGYRMIRSSLISFKDTNSKTESKGFLEGFMISFLNPKILVFFVAVFSQFINKQITNTEKAVIVAIAGIIDTMWYVSVAVVLAKSGFLVKFKANSHLIDRIVGCILIIISFSILLEVFNIF